MLISSCQSSCLTRLSSIGNMTHILLIIRTLCHCLPDIWMTWVIGKIEAELLSRLADMEFIVFRKCLGTQAFPDMSQNLSAARALALDRRTPQIALCFSSRFKKQLNSDSVPVSPPPATGLALIDHRDRKMSQNNEKEPESSNNTCCRGKESNPAAARAEENWLEPQSAQPQKHPPAGRPPKRDEKHQRRR